MIGSGGLEDDPRWAEKPGPDDQPGAACLVVAELLDQAPRVDVGVEVSFRNIDADDDIGGGGRYGVSHLFLSHACHSGVSNTQVSVRASRKRKGRSNSSSVSIDRHVHDPSLSPSAGCSPPM